MLNFLIKSLLKDDIITFNSKILEYKDFIDEKNKNGETLLNLSVYNGLIEKFYILMENNASLNITNEKNNLLHYASYSGKDPFLIVELIKMGINPTEKNIYGETSLHLSSDSKISHYLYLWTNRNHFRIDSLLDNNNNTVLHSACLYKHKSSIEYWKKINVLKDKINTQNHTFLDILNLNEIKTNYFLKEPK